MSDLDPYRGGRPDERDLGFDAQVEAELATERQEKEAIHAMLLTELDEAGVDVVALTESLPVHEGDSMEGERKLSEREWAIVDLGSSVWEIAEASWAYARRSEIITLDVRAFDDVIVLKYGARQHILGSGMDERQQAVLLDALDRHVPISLLPAHEAILMDHLRRGEENLRNAERDQLG